MRALKWLGLLLAGVVGLLVAAVLVLLFVIDPNDYKDRISAVVADTSGYHLNLEGDLSWSFYPILGFESEAVSLASGPAQAPWLTLQTLTIGVQVMPLFSGELHVDALQLKGVNANLISDQQGKVNWLAATPAGQTQATGGQPANAPSTQGDAAQGDVAEPGGAPTELPELSIPLVRVLDSSVRYQDLAAGSDLSVHIDALDITDVQLHDPIGIHLQGRFEQPGTARVELDLTTSLQLDLAAQRYTLAPLVLKGQVSDALPQPMLFVVEAEAQADLAADTAALTLARVSALNAVMQGSVAVTQLTQAPAFSGKLTTQPLALPKVLAPLGVTLPPTANPNALQQASLDLTFNGTPERIALPQLTVTLDQSTLRGSAAVTDLEKQALTFDLTLDAINLDDYLPPVSDAPAASTASTAPTPNTPAEPADLIPVEALRPLNLKGTLKAGLITVEQEPIRDLILAIQAKDGLVEVKQLQADVLSGRVQGALTLDVRQAEPALRTNLNVQNIELTNLSSRFMDTALLSGKANADLDTTATGNTVDALLQSALGQLNLRLDDGVLHGVNLNAIAVDALRDQVDTVEKLVPNYGEYLPRQLRKDTEITKLLANARVENGHLIMPKFEFFTGESGIDAEGKVDLLNQGFDYQFGVVLSALERNKYLKGTRWPIECAGELAGDPSSWCGPDTRAMRKILSAAARNAVKDKGAAEIGEKVGLDADDQDQLEAELKQKAKAEEDRAKRKVQDRLDKWLNK